MSYVDALEIVKRRLTTRNHKPQTPNFKYRLTKLQILILGFCSLMFVLLFLYFFWDLPNPMRLTSQPFAASTKLFDRNGQLIYEVFASERRTPISLAQLPDHVWKATLAAEDKDFYKHSGFSLTGIGRALINTFFRSNTQGGSTITQQLVKNALLTPERTIKRKVREFALSIIVEVMYKKDQILEMYLNQVPYGGTAYGIESAAQTYFGKSATQLSISEAALLAGLPQAPSLYSPFGAQPEKGKARQDYVLGQMLASKFITKDQYDEAINEDFKFADTVTLKAPHFSLWVKNILIEKYGDQVVEQGGLKVITSLDLNLQQFAQDTVASEVAKLKREKVGNGAVLVTNPKTGEVLAMVGSKDYWNLKDDGNVNVVLAKRQPGSAIKPITYAIAMDMRKITAATVLADKPTCWQQSDQPLYCPVNYDGQFHGPTQARFALANSFNIPAVKVITMIGLKDFVASASAFGLKTLTDPTKYGPSLTLGGGEVTMLDLATSFGVLANAGQRVDINPILLVEDKDGKILESVNTKDINETTQKSRPFSYFKLKDRLLSPVVQKNIRVISPGAAYIISAILSDNGSRSATFGTQSYLNIKNHPEVSVKTGTTNDKRDNWAIGYTPDVLAAVWVGNNDNSAMANVASGVTGASPIWNKIMTKILADYPQHLQSKPPDVDSDMVCSLSGYRSGANPSAECSPRFELFIRGTQPPYGSLDRRLVPVFRPTNTIATYKQQIDQPNDIESREQAVIIDPLGTILCTDCAGGYGGSDIIRIDRFGKAMK